MSQKTGHYCGKFFQTRIDCFEREDQNKQREEKANAEKNRTIQNLKKKQKKNRQV